MAGFNSEAAAADNVEQRYLQHRADMATGSAKAWAAQRLNQQPASQQSAPSEAAPQTTQTTPAPQTTPAAPRMDPERRPAQVGDDPTFAQQLGTFTVQIPRSLAHGVQEAANSVLDLGAAVDNWMASKVGTIDVTTGNWITPGEHAAGERIDYAQVDTIPEPDTTAGKMLAGITQFLTGFTAANATKPFKAWQTINQGEKAVKAAAAGAAADFTAFNGQEERLSNLLQQYPALQNPVTEFLQSDPNDGEIEGRFKNALEGLGLGVVTDGLLLGLKTMRAGMIAKRLAPAADEAGQVAGDLPTSARPEPVTQGIDALGDPAPDAPRITVGTGSAKTAPEAAANDAEVLLEGKPETIKKQAQVLAEGKAPAETGEMFVNFARIDTPEDIKATIEEMAENYKAADIDPARRGDKVSFEQMQLGAKEVDAYKTLQARRTGEPLNAEQSVAVRQLWASSARKLQELARIANDSGSEADLFAFRKMAAIHRSIQAEVIAARTETARALASWRIPAGDEALRYQQIEAALANNGGGKTSRDLAGAVAQAADAGNLDLIEDLIEKTAWAKTRDAFLEGWINSLLSGPKTHLVNAISNTAVIFQQMYERGTAARISQALGDDQAVAMGEHIAQWHGMVNGLRDGFRFAWHAMKTGEAGMAFGVDPETGAYFNKVEFQPNSISSAAFDVPPDGLPGRTLDFLGAITNVPSKALGAADEFFKTLGYRMEIHARALRMAQREVNSGTLPPDQLGERMAQIVNDPPADIRLAAIDQATYQTFTNTPGALAQGLSKIKQEFPVVNLILPFVRTPANIMTYTFERTPLAPLMKHYREDIAAGGARRDMALAKISTGTAIMLAVADFANSDQLTGKGPSNTVQRNAMLRSGWQPYSVKVGERYFAYNRLDPLGMTIGIATDITEILANDQYGVEKEKTVEQAIIASAAAIGSNLTSKTYLSGVSEFFAMMSDPQRNAENWFKRMAGSVIPTAVAEMARFNDPYMRETQNMVEAIQRRIPFYSDDLPARRDLWGEPISYKSGLGATYDLISPIYSRRQDPAPIDLEILRHEMSVNAPFSKMSFDGVSVDLDRFPGAYSRFMELQGQQVTVPAYGDGNLKTVLNEIVQGNHLYSSIYERMSDGPDGGKALFVRDVITRFRDEAKKQLIEETPDLKQFIDTQRDTAREKQLENLLGFAGVPGAVGADIGKAEPPKAAAINSANFTAGAS